jgi:pimeloyl-ACP methyl ester carboxylesterase
MELLGVSAHDSAAIIIGGKIKHLAALLLFLFAMILAGCIPASTIPIGATSFHRSEKTEQRTLLVFLPGRGDTVNSYVKEGFMETLHRLGIEADAIGVEAHLGYYRDRTLLQRLKEDVIAKAKADGYGDIWLVGISMGGLGAVLYDTTYPGDVAGVLLLAPYLGDGTLLNEISAAGGLAAWQPAVGGDDSQDREIWQKLKMYSSGVTTAGRVFLGFGNNDRFAPTNRFFAGALPPNQVITAPGGHDWPVWKVLWPRLLELSPLRARKK